MTDCSCLIENDGYDQPEFFFKKIQKARKIHKCFECGYEIQHGEEYERVFGKWCGDIEVFKTCKDCLSIRNAMFCGFYHGGIWEDLEESLEYDECLSEIIPKITDRAKSMIEELLSRKAQYYEE